MPRSLSSVYSFLFQPCPPSKPLSLTFLHSLSQRCISVVTEDGSEQCDDHYDLYTVSTFSAPSSTQAANKPPRFPDTVSKHSYEMYPPRSKLASLKISFLKPPQALFLSPGGPCPTAPLLGAGRCKAPLFCLPLGRKEVLKITGLTSPFDSRGGWLITAAEM